MNTPYKNKHQNAQLGNAAHNHNTTTGRLKYFVCVQKTQAITHKHNTKM